MRGIFMVKSYFFNDFVDFLMVGFLNMTGLLELSFCDDLYYF